MAFTYTVDKVMNIGAVTRVYGSFTSAVGDNAMSLVKSTHGLNQVLDARVELDSAVLDAHAPKVSWSGSTVTATFADTRGYSGKFVLDGRH